MGEQEPWAFASPTGTREQCAFKTSRRAIVSPSLPLIVACFQPCFPVTFAGCEREQRCARPARCQPEEGAVPAGDGAAPGPAQPRARSGNPACLSLVTLPHPSCSSGVPLLLARPAVASSCRVRPPRPPQPSPPCGSSEPEPGALRWVMQWEVCAACLGMLWAALGSPGSPSTK